jgi:hypothetical protein
MPGAVGNPWAAAAQRAAAATAKGIDVSPTASKVNAHHYAVRAGNFTCPACQVGENNAKLPDYFTAWECWACGDTQETLPRPLERPTEPADAEM